MFRFLFFTENRFFSTQYILIKVFLLPTPPTSSPLPTHLNLYPFCLSFENKQESKE